MPAAFSIPDCAALLGCFLAVLAVAVWAGRSIRTSDDLLAGGRTAPWALVGFGFALAGPVAVCIAVFPREGYFAGLGLLWIPAMLGAAVPVVLWLGSRLYYNLDPDSIYEYLELRFDPATRTWAAMLFLLGQVVWLACVLAACASALDPAVGGAPGVTAVVALVGGVATVSASLGGTRAAAWTAPAKWFLLGTTFIVLLAGVGDALDGQTGQIAQTAVELGRASVVDTSFDWSNPWSVWSAGPCFLLLGLFFFLADQATVGRLLAARDLRAMNRAALFGVTLACLALPVAAFAGMGLLAVYHTKAQEEMRPSWVANAAADPRTGRPMIGLDTPIDAATIDALVAKGAILDPNTDRPFQDGRGLMDREGRVAIDRLATWDSRPCPGQPRKRLWERRLRRGRDELLSWFVARHVGPGWRGVLLAGLAVAALAAMEGGLVAIAAVLLSDFHRRHGWAEKWLARKCGKEPPQLDDADELRLARPVVLVAGCASTLLAVALAQVGDLLRLAVLLASLAAAPFLAAFILGLFTRRATGPAVRAAMVVGVAATLWLAAGCYLAGSSALGGAWPWSKPLGFVWPLPLGLGAALVAGYVLSYWVGRRKGRAELAGLVVGLGTWGIVAESEAGRSPQAADRQEQDIVWLDRDGRPGHRPWSG